MNFTFHHNITRLGVLALGLVICVAAGKSLKKQGEFEREPNILSLNGSPFGKTIAMAMQGPVDVYWHEGEAHDHVHVPGEPCNECDHDTASVPTSDPSVAISTSLAPHENCDHGDCDHASHGEQGDESGGSSAGGDQAAEIAAVESVPSTPFSETLRVGILAQIQDWRAVKNTRHNKLANSENHKHFIRRQVEKKLMVTYRMDPTNYASYGAYFLFLSESSLADREGTVQKALLLSQMTVQQCFKEQQDAQTLLTGAAAAHDTAQLLVNIGSDEAMSAALQYTQAAEQFLVGFEQVALQMAFDGSWNNYSEKRRAEMTERARLLRKLVEADRIIQGRNAGNQTAEGGAPTG